MALICPRWNCLHTLPWLELALGVLLLVGWKARDPDTVIGVELRIEQNGASFLADLATDKSEIERRSAGLLAELEAHGWKAYIEKRPH